VYQFSLLDVSETSVLLLPGENTWSDPKHGTKSNTLEVWYKYFSTGKPEHFFALMQTLPLIVLREICCASFLKKRPE